MVNDAALIEQNARRVYQAERDRISSMGLDQLMRIMSPMQGEKFSQKAYEREIDHCLSYNGVFPKRMRAAKKRYFESIKGIGSLE